MQNPHAAPLPSSRIKTFKIDDHEYSLITHGHREGRYYALRTAAMLPGPLSDAINHVKDQVGLAQLFDFFQEEGAAATLAGVLDKYDLKGVGDHIAEILANMAEDDKFLDGLFKYVTRDGVALNNESNLSNAFSGNWVEYDQAVLQVIHANGWLPFQFTSES